jgi:transketolase
MEDVKKWHHGVPSDEQYLLAMEELDKRYAELSS